MMLTDIILVAIAAFNVWTCVRLNKVEADLDRMEKKLRRLRIERLKDGR